VARRPGAPARWTNALDRCEVTAEDGALPLAALFAHLPVALLTAE
jgi:maltooligosyltrehalose synthase